MLQNYSAFQVGNWIVYRPEGNYCTIKSLSPELILEGAIQDYTTTIECIEKIGITEDKLQVCGFKVDGNIFFIDVDDEICVALALSTPGIYTLYKNGSAYCEVQFIHQVQNAYYEITGKFLKSNLYGVREG